MIGEKRTHGLKLENRLIFQPQVDQGLIFDSLGVAETSLQGAVLVIDPAYLWVGGGIKINDMSTHGITSTAGNAGKLRHSCGFYQ